MSLAASNKARAAFVAAVLAGVAACSSTPPVSEPAAQPAVAVHPLPADQSASNAPAAAQPAGAAAAVSSPAPAAGGAPAPKPEVSDQARQDFDQGVVAMRAGNAAAAQADFQQVAATYPQFAAPLVNLAILQRKDGHLDQAEDTLKQATARESGNAIAWTELGVTQRLRGEFTDAKASYEHALAADPRYAPAWRNLGVLSDLYLGDPESALKDFEQYKEISGEDKPVTGWIAELRARLKLPPLKRPTPEAAPGAPDATPAAPPVNPGDTTPPAGAPAPQSSEGGAAAAGG
jgi:tetratricopeptide (TPR) repeat protein